MDVERHLICRILQENDLTPAADAGIRVDFFKDPEHREVYKTLLSHHREYGQLPSLSALKLDYPNYRFIIANDTVEFLIDKIKEQHVAGLLEDGIATAVDHMETQGYDEALTVLHAMMRQTALDIQIAKDTDLTKTGDARLERYAEYRDNPGGMRGIPTGFDSVDKATMGAQNGQLITFVGPPKAGKSTLLLLMAKAAFEAGYRPLFVGFEMSNEEQEERFDAITAQISHYKLRAGTLDAADWKKLERKVHQLEAMQPFIFSADASSATTLTGIMGKIEKYEPDIVFVDGVYMMDDEEGQDKGSPQALTNISRGFKRIAQRVDVPIVISTQVLEWKLNRKKGITADSIGYSSSFAQDSDVILGVLGTDDPKVQKLSVVTARNAPRFDSYIQWDWDRGVFKELDGDPFEEDENENTPSRSW